VVKSYKEWLHDSDYAPIKCVVCAETIESQNNDDDASLLRLPCLGISLALALSLSLAYAAMIPSRID